MWRGPKKFWTYHRSKIIALLFGAVFLSPLLFYRAQVKDLFFQRFLVNYFIHPVAEGVRFGFQGVEVLWDSYFNLISVRKENVALKEERQKLQFSLVEKAEILSENSRLRKIINLKERKPLTFVTAQIIGRESTGLRFSFLINVGKKQGVRINMPVMTSDGVIGSVKQVFNNSSLFLSLYDPTHKMDALVAKSRAQIIVQGGGTGLLARSKYLDRAKDVRVGDLILSSGLDGIFPKGLPIGHVVELLRPKIGVLQEAKIRPIVSLAYSEEVLVLTGKSLEREALLVESESAAQ